MASRDEDVDVWGTSLPTTHPLVMKKRHLRLLSSSSSALPHALPASWISGHLPVTHRSSQFPVWSPWWPVVANNGIKANVKGTHVSLAGLRDDRAPVSL